MRITKVYTRTGDKGITGLANGKRISKSHPRIIALGALDETNTAIGMVLSQKVYPEIEEVLKRAQHVLFNIGGSLATIHKELGIVLDQDVTFLEAAIDQLNQSLSNLEDFILPGGTPIASLLHHARSICRRAERDLVSLKQSEEMNEHYIAYLNRLSDYLFVAARYQNMKEGGKETLWYKK